MLIVGLATVLAMAIALVVDASAAYLQRQGLDTLADGAALHGADLGATGEDVYEGGVPEDRLELTAGRVRAAVGDYLVRVGAYARYPGLSYSVRVEPASASVVVRLTRPARPAADDPGVTRAGHDRRHRFGGRRRRRLTSQAAHPATAVAHAWAARDNRVMGGDPVPTYCPLCVSRCGARARVADGTFLALLPDPSHPTGKAICLKGKAAPEIVYHRSRLLHPLRRTSPRMPRTRGGSRSAGTRRWTRSPSG